METQMYSLLNQKLIWAKGIDYFVFIPIHNFALRWI